MGLSLNKNNTLFQEGIIDDALRLTGHDQDSINKINNDLNNSDNNMLDKAGILNREIGDELGNVSDRINRKINKTKVDTRSIVARARQSVLQFPLYVSQTLRVNEAHTIGKLFERVYATLVQTVLSQNQIMDEDEANNLVFLKQFHTNIRESADVMVNKYYQPIDDLDQMMVDSIFHTQKLTENCTVEFRVVPTDNKILIQENARLANEPLEGFAYLSEAYRDKSFSDKTTNSLDTLSENDLRDMVFELNDYSEEDKKLLSMSSRDIENDMNVRGNDNADGSDTTRYNIEQRLRYKTSLENRFQDDLDQLKQDIKDGKHKGINYINGRYVRKRTTTEISTRDSGMKASTIDKYVDAPTLLKDGDIKKLNGMLPYSMECTFRLRTRSGIDRDIKYVIGIKTIMHRIRRKDLSDDLRDLVTGNIKSLRKVKYKTGEISFKDYLFNIKGIKADAAKNINYNKKWINTLKRLAEYRNLNGTMFKKPVEGMAGGNVPIPNGTLILTQPDVAMLTSETGIDLTNVSDAKRLAKNLFLIAIVIVDSSEGSMKVLFTDSDNDWDIQSLAAIDGEVAKTDNSQLMRELNRVVNR